VPKRNGRPPRLDTPLSRWMWENGYTAKKLARAAGGIHHVTIQTYRNMPPEELRRRINPFYGRLLRAMFQGIPILLPKK